MQRIVTAITVAALAFSLVAQATPAAAAVTGYDSSYAGESAFLSLDQGDDGSFTVFFSNTGSTTWTRGASTQVDLAACNEDKVTCNSQDASEADFNDGWQSSTRYATHTQAAVAPGSLGTFTYNVTVPDDAAEDTYRFNGALVLSSTGADIRNEGYFQDVTVGAGAPTEGAATIDELDPDEGSTEGGDEVTITGEDIVCTPAFPTVDFGDNEADVTSCGATSLVVETPAGAAGDVDVTVTNTGAEASNALTFTYADTTGPTFDSVDVEGQIVTLNFSEPVCVDGAELVDADEIIVRVNGERLEAAEYENEFTDADCDDEEFQDTATVTIIDTAEFEIVEGDTVSVTITSDGAELVLDEADNELDAAVTRSADATADDTDPTIESAEVSDTDEITVTFTEPVLCEAGSTAASWEFDNDTQNETFDITAVADEDGNNCADIDIAAEAVTSLVLTLEATGGDQGDEGTLSYTRDDDNDIEDLSGNVLDDADVDVTPLGADFPLIDDAALTDSGVGGSGSTADSGDEITLTFNEDLDDLSLDDKIRVQDEDGTIADINCEAIVDIGTQTVAASNDDNELDAACELDDDELTIELREDSDVWGAGAIANPVTDETDTANTNLIALGDTPGLQWPATIIDSSGITDPQDNDPDLDASDDVVINVE